MSLINKSFINKYKKEGFCYGIPIFSKSETKQELKIYLIEYKQNTAIFNISFKDTLCRILSLDSNYFKKESNSKDSTIFLDQMNLFLRFDKLEKKYSKSFIKKLENYPLNEEDFSNNLNYRPRNQWKNNQNASKLIEKYTNLAREALSNGDKILSESYFQHADHFIRIQGEKEIIKSNSSNKIEELRKEEVEDTKEQSPVDN